MVYVPGEVGVRRSDSTPSSMQSRTPEVSSVDCRYGRNEMFNIGLSIGTARIMLPSKGLDGVLSVVRGSGDPFGPRSLQGTGQVSFVEDLRRIDTAAGLLVDILGAPGAWNITQMNPKLITTRDEITGKIFGVLEDHTTGMLQSFIAAKRVEGATPAMSVSVGTQTDSVKLYSIQMSLGLDFFQPLHTPFSSSSDDMIRKHNIEFPLAIDINDSGSEEPNNLPQFESDDVPVELAVQEVSSEIENGVGDLKESKDQSVIELPGDIDNMSKPRQLQSPDEPADVVPKQTNDGQGCVGKRAEEMTLILENGQASQEDAISTPPGFDADSVQMPQISETVDDLDEAEMPEELDASEQPQMPLRREEALERDSQARPEPTIAQECVAWSEKCRQLWAGCTFEELLGVEVAILSFLCALVILFCHFFGIDYNAFFGICAALFAYFLGLLFIYAHRVF